MLQQQIELKAKVLRLLDEHRFITVATLREDGWPQATMVGYVHYDLTLFFAVARSSQKRANIERDGRISIALGHDEPTRLHGLSMAARAEIVTDLSEVDAVNQLLRDGYRGRVAFSPREAASVLVRAEPTLISIVDVPKGPGEPVLISVADGEVRRVTATPGADGREAVIEAAQTLYCPHHLAGTSRIYPRNEVDHPNETGMLGTRDRDKSGG